MKSSDYWVERSKLTFHLPADADSNLRRFVLTQQSFFSHRIKITLVLLLNYYDNQVNIKQIPLIERQNWSVERRLWNKTISALQIFTHVDTTSKVKSKQKNIFLVSKRSRGSIKNIGILLQCFDSLLSLLHASFNFINSVTIAMKFQ